jgi:hypothetical protein
MHRGSTALPSTGAHERSTPSPGRPSHLDALEEALTGALVISRSFTLLIELPAYNTCDGPTTKQPVQEVSMSLIERLHHMKGELSEGENDPWRRTLERALPSNLTCTSTVSILALLGFPVTTGNARRLARTMRQMGWVGIKSRRLAPGGWRTTECRGWARSFRELKPKREACHVS